MRSRNGGRKKENAIRILQVVKSSWFLFDCFQFFLFSASKDTQLTVSAANLYFIFLLCMLCFMCVCQKKSCKS